MAKLRPKDTWMSRFHRDDYTAGEWAALEELAEFFTPEGRDRPANYWSGVAPPPRPRAQR